MSQFCLVTADTPGGWKGEHLSGYRLIIKLVARILANTCVGQMTARALRESGGSSGQHTRPFRKDGGKEKKGGKKHKKRPLAVKRKARGPR